MPKCRENWRRRQQRRKKLAEVCRAYQLLYSIFGLPEGYDFSAIWRGLKKTLARLPQLKSLIERKRSRKLRRIS